MSRRARLLAVAPAVAVAALELALLLDDGSASAPALVLAVAGAAALAWRRAAPLPVFAVALAAAAAMVAIGEPPSGAAALVALYSVAELRPPRTSLKALVPALATVTVLTAASSGGAASVVAGAAAAAGAWGLGAYARERALRAVEAERAAIARELHDIVAHTVSVMLIGVRGARDVVASEPAVAQATLAQVETAGEQSLADLRRLLALLRGSAGTAPQPSLADLDALVAGIAGPRVELRVTGERRPLAGGIELSVYRIVQEALTNVIRHASATRVTVTLAFQGSRLALEVVDDGAARPAPPGHGLDGMRERVALLGGALEAGPLEGGGYRIAATLPAP